MSKLKLAIQPGNSKLGKKVWNISLPPGLSCPKNIPCYKSSLCYAHKAWRQYKNVREAWTRNWDAWNSDNIGYFEAIADFCVAKKVEQFRWHVAGDIPNIAYYHGMCLVAHCFTETKFLAFTKVKEVVYMDRPQNFKLVYSMWPGVELDAHELEALESHAPLAWMVPKVPTDPGYDKALAQRLDVDILDCHGKCDECFMCFALEPGQGVAFHQH